MCRDQAVADAMMQANIGAPEGVQLELIFIFI